MNTCKECGAELLEGARFCRLCGREAAEAAAVGAAAKAEEQGYYRLEPKYEQASRAAAQAAGGAEAGGQKEPEKPPKPKREGKEAKLERRIAVAEEAKQKIEAQDERRKQRSRRIPATMSIGEYVGALIVLSLPIAGFICMIVWTCGGCRNQNKANLARAFLILWAVAIVVALIIIILVSALGRGHILENLLYELI